MPETSTEVIKRYLDDAIAAEKSFESQLRSFAGEGDDEEVRGLFERHADETRRQHERLAARLEALGGRPSTVKSALAHIFSFAPRLAQAGHQMDERVAQNLVVAFAVENSECAMYEALISVAKYAGDNVTELLAREIQAEEKSTADKLWHLIPSRAKIAYNMLTASETDPAVETRADENRIV